MRQVVLVVVLVAAAFLGGAFVNGPGLRWAQTQILGSLGLNEGGEIASVDLKNPASPDMTGDGARLAKAGNEPVPGPLAPIPSLVPEGGKGSPDPSAHRPMRPDGADQPGAPPASSVLSSQSTLSPQSPASPLASSDAVPPKGTGRMGQRFARESSGRAAPGRLDPDVKPAVASSSPGPATPDRDLAPPLMDSLAALMPAEAPPPPEAPAPSPDASPAPPTPSEPATTPPTGGDDWSALDRKMQTLGVSRYTIEGQPGGRVVFSCLIPLAGRQAVTQRFEAEGDDGFQAAQAALRRVALWRATQSR
ncbi:MAG: hypothetical protein ACLQGP_01660 [Isosphaeraceae bacterium]